MGGAFSIAQGGRGPGGPGRGPPFLLALESEVRSFIYALWYGPFPCAREGGSSLPSAPSRCWSLLAASNSLSYPLLPSGFNLLLRIYSLFFCSMNSKKGILETYSQRKEFSCRLV